MAEEFHNLLEGFWHQTKTRANKNCVVQKQNGQWVPFTWAQVGEKVARLANQFQKSGLQPGDRVAIFSDNCPEWIITDFALMAAGLVSVPLYPSLTEAQARQIIEHSGARHTVVRGDDRLKKVCGFATLEKIITIDCSKNEDSRIVEFHQFLKPGNPSTKDFASGVGDLNLQSLATIVYTSGTTGEAKGVMLSHGNISAQARMLGTRAVRKAEDIVLSYLPLSHITERANIFRQAFVGYPIYFAQSFETVAQDTRDIRPTSFVAVPRIWEKYQEAIQAKLSQSSPRVQRLVRHALNLSSDYVQNKNRGPLTILRLRILQKLLGPKVRRGLGFDRCRLYISGAAPLDIITISFFYAFGISLIEAFGMTECAGASHFNHQSHPAFGTVGPVLDEMEFKFAEDGELLLRGPNVFMGYYKDPHQTSEAIKKGWLHTGDIGKVDDAGNLSITDRKKNIIITAGGKNIAPAILEFKIKRHPLVSQAVVIGDRRKYLTALVTLAPGAATTQVQNEIQKHLDHINSELASFETIKKFTILERDFTAETGELTPTLKTKRAFIQEKYKSLIDQMYV